MREIQLRGSVELVAAAADGASKPATFSMVAYTGSSMKPGGYGLVIVDAAGVSVPSENFPILRDHSPEKIIGHAERHEVRKDGAILVEGVVSGANDHAKEVVESAKRGFKWQASVGMSVEKTEFVESGATAKANGKTVKGPVTIIRGSTLREASFVPIGADGKTSASIAAKNHLGDRGKMMNDFDQWLAASGFDAAALSDQQKATLRAAYDAQRPTPKNGEHGSPATPAEVETLFAKYSTLGGSSTELQAARAEALELALSPRQAELKMLLAARGSGASNHIVNGRGGPDRAEVLAASMLVSQGVAPQFVAAEFGEKVADAATRRENRGLGLHALCRMALQARGVSIGPGRLTESHLREALDVRAGYSTLSVPGILGNVANKSMLAAFTATPTTWNKFSRTSSVDDFKEATSYRLSDAGHIEEVPAGGEIKSTTLTESTFTRQALQYGKLLTLDRKSIVNDDLGIFNTVPAMLARMSAMTVERKVYEAILGNAGNFFHSSNGNNLTGGGSALGDAGLTAAYKAMQELEDADGRPVLVVPQILLVSPALWRTARSLTQSTGTNATTTANTPLPDGNPWAGMFEVVSSPYLGLSQEITNGSDTLWYLTTGANDFSIVDVCFLNGMQTPTVEQIDAPANQLGLTIRVVFDFGVSLHEPKGGVRNAGA
jgi:Mu-like prophage major head subunit gpT